MDLMGKINPLSYYKSSWYKGNSSQDKALVALKLWSYQIKFPSTCITRVARSILRQYCNNEDYIVAFLKVDILLIQGFQICVFCQYINLTMVKKHITISQLHIFHHGNHYLHVSQGKAIFDHLRINRTCIFDTLKSTFSTCVWLDNYLK